MYTEVEVDRCTNIYDGETAVCGSWMAGRRSLVAIFRRTSCRLPVNVSPCNCLFWHIIYFPVITCIYIHIYI